MLLLISDYSGESTRAVDGVDYIVSKWRPVPSPRGTRTPPSMWEAWMRRYGRSALITLKFAVRLTRPSCDYTPNLLSYDYTVICCQVNEAFM